MPSCQRNRENETFLGIGQPEQGDNASQSRQHWEPSVGAVITLVDAARFTHTPCPPKSTPLHFMPRHVGLYGGSKPLQRVCMFEIIDDVLQLLQEHEEMTSP